MVDLSNFKPLEKASNNDVKEVPEHSMGIDPKTKRLVIRVDSGKFMDTVFEYTQWEKDSETGFLKYDSWIQSLMISGISMNTNQMSIEQAQEFQDYVATPIFKHIIAHIAHAQQAEQDQEFETETKE